MGRIVDLPMKLASINPAVNSGDSNDYNSLSGSRYCVIAKGESDDVLRNSPDRVCWLTRPQDQQPIIPSILFCCFSGLSTVCCLWLTTGDGDGRGDVHLVVAGWAMNSSA